MENNVFKGIPLSTDITQPAEEKRRPGRPVGATARYSSAGARKLASLGFDPIEHMVALYHKNEGLLATMDMTKSATMVREDGSIVRYSAIAHAQLLALQQKLVGDLLRYGYARVPETINVNDKPVAPMVIEMTPIDGKFVPMDIEDSNEDDHDED